jgi:phosphate transport system substrate-binding protein
VKFTNIASVAALVATGVLFAGAAAAQSRDTIQIAGSSTVLPFASVVAEEFGNTYPEFNTPVVGSGGTGGGLKQFCAGVGDNTIDIANASRPIKAAEIEQCNAAGVKQIVEVKVGYDGIVFASDRSTATYDNLTPKMIFQALAAEVPVDGKMAANPYQTWNQIDASLPEQPITMVIPGSNHGTREVFTEKVVTAGCEEFPEIKALDKDAMTKACQTFRADGKVIEVAGDYTETLGRLDAQKAAIGVFGLSFYEQNKDRLHVANIEGVTPTLESVASGEYPVSRPLFFYIKGEHMGVIPGIQEYAEFFLSDQMVGADGQLVSIGLIPMPDEERQAQLANIQNKTVVQPAASN